MGFAHASQYISYRVVIILRSSQVVDIYYTPDQGDLPSPAYVHII